METNNQPIPSSEELKHLLADLALTPDDRAMIERLLAATIELERRQAEQRGER